MEVPAIACRGSPGAAFRQKAELDIEKLIATSKGAAQSWQMENRYKTMVAGTFDFGFAVDWMRKDLAIRLGRARRNGAHLPATGSGRSVLLAGVERGAASAGTRSSLIALLQR
jgi:3-hydroxyisobutyrate dehydrogenase